MDSGGNFLASNIGEREGMGFSSPPSPSPCGSQIRFATAAAEAETNFLPLPSSPCMSTAGEEPDSTILK